jgi:anti-sigma regulatory factor (Ser/Thr protein kinase)
VAWRVVQELRPGVRAGSLARGFCTRRLISVLDEDGHANDVVADAATIANELVLNAVNAGSSQVRLCLAFRQGSGPDHPGRLRIEVLDDAEGVPTLQRPSPTELRGRGLQIVDALADRWGVRREQELKAVWAEVDVPGRGEPATPVKSGGEIAETRSPRVRAG